MKKSERDARHMAKWILNDKENKLSDLANLMGTMPFDKREQLFDAIIKATMTERNKVKGDGWVWQI